MLGEDVALAFPFRPCGQNANIPIVLPNPAAQKAWSPVNGETRVKCNLGMALEAVEDLALLSLSLRPPSVPIELEGTDRVDDTAPFSRLSGWGGKVVGEGGAEDEKDAPLSPNATSVDASRRKS